MLINSQFLGVFKPSLLLSSAIIFVGIVSPLGIEAVEGRDRELLCKGNIGNLTVQHLRVPRGYTCHLRGTLVQGRVTVESQAILKTSGAYIKGNLRVYPGHKIDLDPTTRLSGRLYALPQ